ncbi:LacI family DNA-binding transcriptional regulator [Actinotalea sp. K2]|uniref:LacI family DNA-binding transcriptional regulator n=1 Tax=Actinotalea sp. K2 TaxID=2939438 RepID=UPI002016C15F|nr:LacI family DNA-binding transcriptional regulator [Actinotalea sp. K2]MCL3861567.1 LacI family DNA-binding transcriptional regulator [Actinotalea sp. K2]
MKRVGIKDVAREAGVSPTTVSLVLNGQSARIPDTTRDRVRRVATEIGYAPNSVARSLRTQRTHTIALISDRIATTPFAVEMVQAAQDVAREHGYLLLLVNTDGDHDVEREAVDALLSRQVDGMVYACMWSQVVDVPAGLPAGTVFLDGRPAGGGFPAVMPDDRAGAMAAVQELVDQGHTRIAYIDAGEEPVPIASRLRHEGYLEVLRRAGIEPDPSLRVEASITTAAGGVAAAGELLDRPPAQRPTAIFCFNDRVAMGAYRAARHRGLEIPTDLSVVGYDDQQFIAAELDPPLTTVALPHYEMGRWAMQVRLGVLAAPTENDGVHLMPCPLIRRESVAPPPAQHPAPAGDGE